MGESRGRRAWYLSVANELWAGISHSLGPEEVLNTALEVTLRTLGLEVGTIHLLSGQELALAAYRGIPPEVAQAIGRMALGEGLNGLVAQTGESLLVEDISQDPRVARDQMRGLGHRSAVVVPLVSRDVITGTMLVASKKLRRFPPEDLDLMVAVGNQIGVALENARLYKQVRAEADELRVLEARYRDLFENANDAIFVLDPQGGIDLVNKAAVRLTGYGPEELTAMSLSDILADPSLSIAGEMEARHREGRDISAPFEVELSKKNGRRATLSLSVRPLVERGRTVGIQAIARDVTVERRMRDRFRYYVGRVTRAQEEERQRIARDLHDETLQSLVLLGRRLDALASRVEGLGALPSAELEEARRLADEVVWDIRRFSRSLRPPVLDHLGLVAALEGLVAEARTAGIDISLEVEGEPRRLGAEPEVLLFRIAQEALRNTEKHARARRAEVRVGFGEGQVRLEVRDEGVGFNPEEKMAGASGLGLLGMQERVRLLNGRLELHSRPGQGTRVVVVAPC